MQSAQSRRGRPVNSPRGSAPDPYRSGPLSERYNRAASALKVLMPGTSRRKMRYLGVENVDALITGEDSDSEDQSIDFSNASLYLTGMQTIFSICCCAAVSVLACWLVPESGVSAVRTLAACTAAGVLLMRLPLRVGRARGVRVVFASLQPCVAIYLMALVVEQLVHTCASSAAPSTTPSRVVFFAMTLTMMLSGFMRARAPLADTDLPFLLTSLALLVIAVFPPPSVAFVGPLCQPVSAWQAAERIVRAFSFSVVYCVHVFASTASSSAAHNETIIVVTRSGSASAWLMACHPLLLPLAVMQCAVVILARLRNENVMQMSPVVAALGSEKNKGTYDVLPAADLEAAEELDVYAEQERLLGLSNAVAVPEAKETAEEQAEPPPSNGLVIGPLKFKQIGGGELPATPASEPQGAMTKEKMAAIAAAMADT